MELILELLVEIVLEGCLNVTEEKKVPMPLRILCGMGFVGFYVGFMVLLLFIALENESMVMLLVTVFVALLVLVVLVYKLQAIRKQRRDTKGRR